MKTKLLYFTYSLDVGGAEKLLVNLLNNMDEKYDITLVLIGNTGPLEKKIMNENIDLEVWNTGFTFKTLIKMNSKIKEFKPKVVFGFLGHINVMLGILKRFNKNVIFIGRENAVYGEYFEKKNFKNIIVKFLYSKYLRNLDVIIAQSNYMKNELEMLFKIPSNNITLKKNPLVIKNDNKYIRNKNEAKERLFNKFKIENVSSRYVLISVGRFNKVKNHRMLVDIMTQLSDQYILLLAGTGSELESVKKYARELNVSHKIHFLGYIEEIDDILFIGDLFLLTSKRESSPNVVIEATINNLYTLAHDMPGGIRDLVVENLNGNVIQFENTTLFSNTIENLCSNDRKNIDFKEWISRTEIVDISLMQKAMKL